MPFLTQPFSIAERVDSVFLFIFVVSAAFLVFITLLMVYFVVRYSRARHPTPVDIEGSPWLEVTWTVIPLVLFMLMFYYGWTNFKYMRNPPRDAMVVETTGRQFAWSFKYPNGKQADELYVALNRPVKLELHSQDVLHGFYIPAFRVKVDVVPGKTNFLWFTPTEVAPAVSPVVARPAAVPSAVSPATIGTAGLALLEEKTCLVCHTVDGTQRVGPTFKGLFGRKETVVADGQEVEILVDEAYLRRSIQEPGAEVVKGYPPAMPQLPLTDRELGEVVEYIKTLR
jgi:cytochrome c oxidase subunit 2